MEGRGYILKCRYLQQTRHLSVIMLNGNTTFKREYGIPKIIYNKILILRDNETEEQAF